jgi:hypothetical protein
MKSLCLKIVFYPLFIAAAFWFEGYMQSVPPGPKENMMYTVIESEGSIHSVIDEDGVASEIRLSPKPPTMFVVRNGQVVSLIEKEME